MDVVEGEDVEEDIGAGVVPGFEEGVRLSGQDGLGEEYTFGTAGGAGSVEHHASFGAGRFFEGDVVVGFACHDFFLLVIYWRGFQAFFEYLICFVLEFFRGKEHQGFAVIDYISQFVGGEGG